MLQLMPLQFRLRGPNRAEDALAGRCVHERGERRFLAQVVGLRGGLGECAQQRGQRAVEQFRPAIVVAATVRVHLTQSLEALARLSAQSGVTRQSLGDVLVQASAAECRAIDPLGGVVTRGAGASLDHDEPCGTQSVQDAPQRGLADAGGQSATDLRLAEAPRLGQEQLQDLVAGVGRHDAGRNE